MSKEDVKVLGAWPSPFVTRVRIALNLKDIEYDFVQETLSSKSDLLLKSNPVHKKIPVLIHADRPVCESLVIIQYIDESWSSEHPILPVDPYDRANARFWAAYIDDKLFPALTGTARTHTDEKRKASISQILEGIALLEETFVKCSRGKPFFGGDTIGYLDIALGCFLAWFKVSERGNGVKFIDEEKVPSLFKWSETFCADATVKDVMPETEKLVEYANAVFSHLQVEAAAAAAGQK